MKFLNSDYSKGYANFAKGKAENIPFTILPKPAPGKDLSKSEKLKTTLAAEKASAQSRIAALKSKSPSPVRPAPKQVYIGSGNRAKDTLERAGNFVKKNKVGVGLAAAGALGAAGAGLAIARKMRSDKGRKRGQYSK